MFTLLGCYGPTSYTSVTEVEAFCGTILGRRGGVHGKALRDNSNDMRERLQNIVDHTIIRITHGDQSMRAVQDLEVLMDDAYPGDRELEGLPRAIAALVAAIETPAIYDYKHVELLSFAYIAASVCLEEFQRFLITTYGRRSMPRI